MIHPRAYVQTFLTNLDSLNGPLDPPETEPTWRGSSWRLVGVSLGPRRFADDPQSPVWCSIAWARGGL